MADYEDIMDKRYRNLIDEAKEYYSSEAPELKNIVKNDKLFDFKWCDWLEQEINLWTYWQGAELETSEIMVIGQDFGTCYDPKNQAFYRYLCESNDDYVKKSQAYISRIEADSKNKTDNNLLLLTAELGKNYCASIPANRMLFFTNMCLGYRSGSGISGGNVSYYLKHDSVYIRELIRIKQPKVVICLGADTYFALLSCLSVDNNTLNLIATDFWTLLENADNFIDISLDKLDLRIYGVSHAGAYGLVNRKKLTGHKDDNFTGLDLMKSDWGRIGVYLNNR